MSEAPRNAGRETSQRLDRWLWFARLVKSRTLAASLISSGKVRVNRERVAKPSQTVRVGDVITGIMQRQIRIVRVAALGARRGPPAEARALYEDLAPIPSLAEAARARAQAAPPKAGGDRAPGSGRPTKRERREIDRLKSGEP